MRKQLSKWLSLVLIAAMLVQIFPASVFATENETAENEAIEESNDIEALAEERPETAEETLASAQILFEEESLREESVKHFRLNDGTYIAVDYGTPVHYEDDGEWVDYDNTLKAINSLDGSGISCYRIDNGESTRVFAAEADADVLLAVQKGNYGLAFAPAQEPDAELPMDPNQPIVANEIAEEAAAATVLDFASAGETSDDPLLAQAQPDQFYSALEYENAINGATLRYENYGNTIKESIVISEPQSEYVYSFDVATDGLTATLQADGSVNFAAADGSLVYYIPAPYMIDANCEYSCDAAYTLAGSDGIYSLTVTADAAWLNAEDRAFPVLLDPTIVETDLTDTSVSATYINSGYSGGTAAYTNLYVGDNGNDNAMMHTLIHINELINIPDGSEITCATFALSQYAYLTKSGGAATLDIGLYPMYSINGMTNHNLATSQWQNLMNGVAWDHVYGSEAYYVFDEDTLITDVTTVSASTSSTLVRWDITLLARMWYDDPSSNVGFILKPTTSAATSRATFTGPESASGKPQFAISYRNAAGVEPYKTYQTASIGRAGTAYISDSGLTQTTIVPLLYSDSNVMPFSLSLVYNSIYGSQRFAAVDDRIHTKAFTNMKLAISWKLSAQETVISKVVDNATCLIYTDADGTEHYFHNDNGTYYDEDGLGLKITASGSNYTMTDDYGNTKYFGNGYLRWITDAYGNKIAYNYNSNAQLATITRTNNGCSAETLATFTYNTNNYLTSITDEASRTITLSYTTVNSKVALSAITFADGAKMHYSYALCDDGQCHMTSAYDSEAAYGMEFAYAEDGTVKYFAEYAGTSKVYGAKFSATKLAHNQTRYRYYGGNGTAGDSDDIFTCKVMDRMGRTINSYSLDHSGKRVLGVGLSNYVANSDTSKENNHVTASASAGQQSVNIIDNASIENASYSAISAYAWSASTNGASIGEVAYLGELSLRLQSASTANGLRYWGQSVSLSAGKTYTFSAYVHVPDGTAFCADGAVYLSLVNSSGTTLAHSEGVNYSTGNVGSGWIRLTATVKITTSCTANARFCATGFSGSVYADAFQLEEEDCAATFNIVEDGSFEYTSSFAASSDTHWYKTGTATISSASGTYFGSKAVKLPGRDDYQRISRSIPVNAPLSSTFILSAWAKAAADPTSEPTQVSSGTPNPYFGLILRFYYSDGTNEAQYYPFDPYYHGWQYMQGIAVPQKTTSGVTISSITIVVAYDDNINTAYFDNVSFRMEPVQTYKYNSDGNLTTSTQTGTGTESATYDGVDLTKYVAANKNVVEYTYNAKHDVLTATSDGVTNTLGYDTRGNITSSVLTGSTLKMSTSATYTTDRNHTASVTDAAGNKTTYAYSTTKELLTSVTNAKNIKTSYYYNENNDRPILVSQDTDTMIAYGYSDGQLEKMTRKSARSGSNLWQRYVILNNKWGQLSTIGLQGSTDGSTFTDKLVLVGYVYYGDDSTITPDTEGYSKHKLQRMTYANGDRITFAYDDLDRLSKKVYTDTGAYVEYYYNSEGALAKMNYYSATQEITTYTFEYDSLGRLIRSHQSIDGVEQQRTEHIYDAFDRLSSQSYVVGGTTFTERYTYSDGANGDGTLTQMTTAHGKTITYTYDALKRLTNKDVKNSSTAVVAYSYDYKDTGTSSGITTTTPLVAQLDVTTKDGSRPVAAKYTYDALGNITQISESASPYYPLVKYTYDSQNQLTKEEHYDGNGTATSNITKTYEYAYDTAGNILTEKVDGTTTKTYTYSTGQWTDKLLAFNGTVFSYDLNGNPLTYANGVYNYSMQWEHGRQLCYTGVDNGRGISDIFYQYDADGIRTLKNDGGNEHYYLTQNGRVIRERIGTGSTAKVLDFIYDESGKPCALIYTNGTATPLTYYYVLNLQGDVVGLVNADGESRAEYTYNAWGEVLSATGIMAAINPLRYRGYYYDTETGFYYLQSRYYDPVTHRFINADSFASTGQGIAGTNMFAYCNNNPVIYSDTTGHWLDFAWDAVSLLWGIADVVQNPDDVTAWVGLALDVVDVVVPCVSGLGEGARAARTTSNIVNAADDAYDTVKAADNVSDIAKTATHGSSNYVGKMGEQLAGIDPRAKTRITVNGRQRIPDALTDTTLTEVKNVKYISNTKQLKDFATYASATGRSLELYVRPTTKVAATVIDAGWNLHYLW